MNAEAGLRRLLAQPTDTEAVRRLLACIVKDGMRTADIVNRTRALIKESAAAEGMPGDQRCDQGHKLAKDLPSVQGDRIAAMHESLVVEVFGCRHAETIPTLRRPASENRQGTKSREVGHRRGSGRYGDLMAALSSGVNVMPTGCGRRICTLVSSEACDRRLGKRLELINERTVR
jgi:hypothetical protein